MAAFFSGTDTNTLREEGSDLPNFVSLIVNNDGNYVAGITRRVTYHEKHQITKFGKYPFYNRGEKTIDNGEVTEKDETSTVVEWFPLVIEKHSVGGDILMERFNQIREKKNISSYNVRSGEDFTSKGWWNRDDADDDDDDLPYSSPYGGWQGSQSSFSTNPYQKFGANQVTSSKDEKEEEKGLFDEPSLISKEDIMQMPINQASFNTLVARILTGTPFVKNLATSPKEWAAKNIPALYNVFKDEEEFGDWAEMWYGYIFNNTIWAKDFFSKETIDEYGLDEDTVMGILAVRVSAVIKEFGDSSFKKVMLEQLQSFIDEYLI